MAGISGEVVPTPGEEMPFKVVFRHADGSLLDETPVSSIPEGEAMIVEILQGVQDAAEEGGL